MHHKLKPSDDGYTCICPICDRRFGQYITGPRVLELLVCDKCMKKTYKKGRGVTDLTKPRLILQKSLRDVRL